MGRPKGYKLSVETREHISQAMQGRPKTDAHKVSLANARLLAEYGERKSPNAVGAFTRGITINRLAYDRLTIGQLTWLLYFEYPV